MKKLFSIIFLLTIFSIAVSLILVSGENKKIDVHVIVSDGILNDSENVSMGRVDSTGYSNPLQAQVIEGDNEVSVKQNEINSSFSNSFNELFSYKSDNSWLLPFISLGIILLLIIIYKSRSKTARKKKVVKLKGK